MGSAISRLDQWLLKRAALARSARRDRALVALTHAASYSRLWLVIAAVLAVGGDARGRSAAGRGLASIAIAAAVANGPAKLLARRRRPLAHSSPALIRMPRSSSFPSGHSAAAFAFATGACSEQPALAAILVPLAAAVAYSRVHAGVHHPSDVVAGSALGIASGVLCARLASARESTQPSEGSG